MLPLPRLTNLLLFIAFETTWIFIKYSLKVVRPTVWQFYLAKNCRGFRGFENIITKHFMHKKLLIYNECSTDRLRQLYCVLRYVFKMIVLKLVIFCKIKFVHNTLFSLTNRIPVGDELKWQKWQSVLYEKDFVYLL